MALADYRLCDVCRSKVFYDSSLQYEFGKSDWYNEELSPEDSPRTAGEPAEYGWKLGELGDWAVICKECAKTYTTAIIERQK